MISKSQGYKFYKNTVMFPEAHLYSPVNVISCLLDVRIQYVGRHTCERAEIDGTVSRDFLTRFFPFKCKFTGYEIGIILNGSEITVPGISFSECDQQLLPSGSPLIRPPTALVRWQAKPRPYILADVILDDEIPIAPVVPAPPPSLPPPPPPTVAAPAISSGGPYPEHVKRIIIADSINKNDSCSITGEIICEENACITTCGHVFTRSAITRWLSVSSNQSCPVCRQKCSVA